MKDLKKKLIAPVVTGSLIATSTVCALAGAANNSSDTSSSDSDNTTNLITSTGDSNSSSSVSSYDAVKSLTSDTTIDGESISSTGTDENVIDVSNNANVTVTNSTMVVDGGSYTSNGTGSPAVYCTADISINNADLTANNSEALCIEGLNTTRLFNCNLSGNMKDDSQNDCTWNVILYQSMSGDSQEDNSTFEMVGGSLTANNGGMFYTTNTESTFILSNVDITYAADSEFFLKCT
jgi:hypothetical protein